MEPQRPQIGGNQPVPQNPPEGQGTPTVVIPGGMEQISPSQATAQFGQPSAAQGEVVSANPKTAPGTVPAVVVPTNHVPVWTWITLVLLALGLIGAAVFAFWSFGQRQDYKNNTDEKIAAAVAVAKKETTDANNLQFAEESKNPLQTYAASAEHGSLHIEYPKTWSGFVETKSSGTVFSGYFHPKIVPADGSDVAMALRVEVRNTSYDRVVAQRAAAVKRGDVQAVAYALPNQPEQIGTKFTGKLSNNLTGTEVVLPLRDKTIVIKTDTDQWIKDFEQYVLANFNFSP